MNFFEHYQLNDHIVLAGCFIIFLYYAYKPLKNSFLKTVDSKINIIKSQVAESESLKAEAEILLNNVQAQLGNITTLKAKMLEEVQQQIELAVHKQNTEVELLIAQKMNEESRYIHYQKSEIYHQMQKDFAEHVTEIVKTYMKSSQNNAMSDYDIGKALMDPLHNKSE